MRILMLLSTSYFSGAENVACQMYNTLTKEEEYEVVYCSPKGDIEQKLKEINVAYFPLDKFSVKEVKRAIKEFSPDVIHAHDMRACLLAQLATKKIPIIGHIHNNCIGARKFSIRSLLFFFIARKLKHIFWVSKSAFNDYKFRASIESKSEVLYNVIDLQAIREQADKTSHADGFDVVYLGRLTYPKNLERLILIVKQLKQKLPNVRVAIIGNGELYEDVQKTIVEYNVEKNVKMLGFQKEPYGILKNSKLLILTSRWEGTPMVVLEALGLGVPVVSTPVDGVVDLIKNGENGFLSDDNDELCREMEKIILDKDYLNLLSQNAIKTSNNFNNLEKYKERLVDIYQKVLRQ